MVMKTLAVDPEVSVSPSGVPLQNGFEVLADCIHEIYCITIVQSSVALAFCRCSPDMSHA